MTSHKVRHCSLITIGIALSLLISQSVIAGPPYTTDNPQPVPLNVWQLYTLAIVNTGHGSASSMLPYFEADYGYMPNVQLHASFSLNYLSPRHGANEYGISDFDVAAKYRFLQEGKSTPMAAFYPHINIPTGDSSRGLGSSHVQVYLPVWLQKSYGHWKANLGGGYFLNPGESNRDYWITGALLQRDIDPKLTLGGELFYTSATKVGGKHQFDFRIGAIYHFDANHHLIVALGRSISGDNDIMAQVGFMMYTGGK